jgi:hypothetical protein
LAVTDYSRVIPIELSGGCQCGAVRYHLTERMNNAHVCHCRMCQKAMGNYFAPLVSVSLHAFRWTRGEPARFKSSANVYRGFCRDCGTPLFLEDIGGDDILITLGSLDHPERVPPLDRDGIQGEMPFLPTMHLLPDTGVTGADDPEWVEAIARTNNQHPDHDTENWEPRHG